MVIKPKFSLSINNGGLEDHIKKNLISITLNEVAKDKSDELTIAFAGIYKRPKADDVISISLGTNNSLFELGTFVSTTSSVDYINQVTEIRATATDFTQTLKQVRNKLWENIDLKGIMSEISGEFGLKSICEAEDKITSSLQNSSDLDYLKNLAASFGQNFSVKSDTLIMRPKDDDSLSKYSVSVKDCSSLKIDISANRKYSGVSLMWHDVETGEESKVQAGTDENLYKMNVPPPKNETECMAQAEGILAQLNAETKRGRLTVTPMEIHAGGVLTLKDTKIDDGQYQITSVTHKLDKSSYLIDVEFN